MTLDQAAIFFTGSILVMMGVVAINNLLHRYWKPIKFSQYEGPRFVEEDKEPK